MSHDTERANAVNLRAQVAILRSQLAESQAREADAALDKAELSRIRPKRGDPYFHSTVEEWGAECRQTADLRQAIEPFLAYLAAQIGEIGTRSRDDEPWATCGNAVVTRGDVKRLLKAAKGEK